MLHENIKNFRKEKGMSQEELAAKLNVVRQTVSKWEQNISVPDSEMLIKLAEVFEVNVGTLLGETVETKNTESELKEISQKLENLNAMLAARNSRSRRIAITVAAIILIIVSALLITSVALGIVRILLFVTPSASLGIIGGADGPTQIIVSSNENLVGIIITAVIAAATTAAGIILIKKLKR